MRLIDLHCNWALQYAGETCQYDAAAYADVLTRLDQVEGYLTGTGIAVLTCGRRAGDWTQQPDAWKTLGEMIARYEAEFSGRLLIGPDDVTRWNAEPPDGIGWGILGIEGFDALVRTPMIWTGCLASSGGAFGSSSLSRPRPVPSAAPRYAAMIGA